MNNWKKKLLDKSSEWPRKVLIKKVKSFNDVRGYIQPLVDLPMCILMLTQMNGLQDLTLVRKILKTFLVEHKK